MLTAARSTPVKQDTKNPDIFTARNYTPAVGVGEFGLQCANLVGKFDDKTNSVENRNRNLLKPTRHLSLRLC